MANNARPKKKAKTRRRTGQPFPASSFEEALEFANHIQRFASGQPIRRLTLFDQLGKSPDSGISRQFITNANRYKLIKGNYSSETLELTADGACSTSDDVPKREQGKARIKLGIENIAPFKGMYDKFVGNKLPSRPVLVDAIQEFDVSEDFAEEGVDTFIVNLRFVGLLQTLSGAERVVTVDHYLDSLPPSSRSGLPPDEGPAESQPPTALVTQEVARFETTCFYITPIGQEDSDMRRHSDLFLESLVEPALEQFGLKVVRADAIDKPGTITRQIIDYLLRSRLAVVDLSYHNPNVFYELAIRHAARLPTVQIIRRADRIPFDLNQMRTIIIDTSDIYALVPKIDTYRSEIANQVRRALQDSDASDNPISAYYPSFRATFEGQVANDSDKPISPVQESA